MVTKEQLSYILQQLQRGEAPEAIKLALTNAGWQQADIEQAFNQVYQAANIVPGASVSDSLYPTISIQKIESPSRFYAVPLLGGFIKLILLIPFSLELIILIFVILILLPLNALIVLFTGKYWKTLYNLISGFMKLNTKASFYILGLTNKYPGFDFNINDNFSVDIKYPEKSNRLFAVPFLGLLIRCVLSIPFMIYSDLILCAATLGGILSSFVVLIKGKYPESMFEFVRDMVRLNQSSILYIFGISDRYPSFSISWNHKVVKIILIVMIFLLWILNIFIPKTPEPMQQDTTTFEEDFYNTP